MRYNQLQAHLDVFSDLLHGVMVPSISIHIHPQILLAGHYVIVPCPVRRAGVGPLRLQRHAGGVVQQARLAFLRAVLLQAVDEARGPSLSATPR